LQGKVAELPAVAMKGKSENPYATPPADPSATSTRKKNIFNSYYQS
jgi:hypothetical protein